MMGKSDVTPPMICLTILGSTGSIGCSTLDVVRQDRDRYQVFSLVAGRNLTVLLSQIKEFLPKVVVVADESLKDRLAVDLAASGLDRSLWPDLLAGDAARIAVSTSQESSAAISANFGVTFITTYYATI